MRKSYTPNVTSRLIKAPSTERNSALHTIVERPLNRRAKLGPAQNNEDDLVPSIVLKSRPAFSTFRGLGKFTVLLLYYCCTTVLLL